MADRRSEFTIPPIRITFESGKRILKDLHEWSAICDLNIRLLSMNEFAIDIVFFLFLT